MKLLFVDFSNSIRYTHEHEWLLDKDSEGLLKKLYKRNTQYEKEIVIFRNLSKLAVL